MSLIAEFRIFADDMDVTNSLYREAVSRNFLPKVPAPGLFALQASLVEEEKVYNLVNAFQDRSTITVRLIGAEGEEIESLDFPQGHIPSRAPAF